MNVRRRQGISILLLGSLALTGCYRTVGTVGPNPPAGLQVVAELTGTGSDVLAEIIGQDAVAVEGRVVRSTADSLSLSVSRVRQNEGLGAEWNGEVVALPTTAISDVRERRLDRVRTGFVIGGIVALATALAVAFVQSDAVGGGGGNGPGGDPAQ